MAGGRVGASSNSQYIIGQINWSATTNTEGNYSDVYAELRMWRTNTGYTTSGTGNWTINIDGSTKTESRSVSLSYNSNTFIISHSTRVGHNADGTKQIWLGVSGGISGTSYTSTNCGATVTLDTIPRASQPSVSNGNFQIGENITIYMNRASGSFTHTVRYGYGSQSGTIATGVTDQVNWTTPMNMCEITEASSQGYGKVYVDTYNGGTNIGTKEVGFYANVPASVVPTTTSVSTSEMTTSPSVATIVGKYVQGLSSIRMYINGATGAYGSTIPTFKFNLNSKNWTNNGYIVDYGTADFSGTKVLTGYVTDSRGRNSVSRTTNVEVLAYSNPNIVSFTAQRCNSDGTLNELGDYVKVVRHGTASSLMNGTEKNTIACKVFYRQRPNTSWIEATTCTVNASSSVATAVGSTAIVLDINGDTAGGGFSITNVYDFKMELRDRFNFTTSQIVVPVGSVVMSWGQSGVGVGKIYQEGALDVGGMTVFNAPTKAPISTDMKIYREVAGWSAGGNTNTGILKIRLPKLWSSTMINMTIKYYDFSENLAGSTIQLSGYTHGYNSSWMHCGTNIIGNAPIHRVRFGHDGTYACIFMGSTNSLWSTPKLIVSEFIAGCAGLDNWDTGWNFSVLTSETNMTFQLEPSIMYGGTLTGEVKYFSYASIPTGYLYCDGATISRTIYSNLFNSIGTTYGAGDGSTTFQIPDLRGEFIRCYDNGRGVNNGREFGSWEEDGFKSHTHNLSVPGGTGSYANTLSAPTDVSNPPSLMASTATGGTETRPRNIALLACIKF